MIDWGRVQELQSDLGVDDFSEVVALFLLEVEAALARLGLAEGGAEAQMRQECHFLLGAALNLGFREFAERARAAERACRGVPPVHIDIRALRRSYVVSRDAFLARLPEFLRETTS